MYGPLATSEVACSLLLCLCLTGGSLNSQGDDGGLGGLVVLGDGHPLAVGGQAPEALAALAAGVPVLVLGHVGSRRAVGALGLELLDLSVGLNGEILKEGLCALLVSVLNLLGGGVNLLFALTLTALGINQSVDDALVNEAGLSKVKLVAELGSAEH